MYSAEYLTLDRACWVAKIDNRERRILRKILGAVNDGEVWILRRNEDLYRSIKQASIAIRKRRAAFHAHIFRMKDDTPQENRLK